MQRLLPLPGRAWVSAKAERVSGCARACTIHATASMDGPVKRESLSVAIIGAGAAGLISAKSMLDEGHSVQIFEQSSAVGGVWKYSDDVDADPLGISGKTVHGSMYEQLRTNLLREVMGVPYFPFDTRFSGSRDPRQFPGHQEVQRYLEAYAEAFSLLQYVHFSTRVHKLTPRIAGGNSQPSPSHPRWPRWEVTFGPTGQDGSTMRHTFDAVVVANGHYSRPRVPQLPGQREFPGLQLHSHNYRRPDPFRGKVVVLVGASFSGIDIAQELVDAGASRVHLCARTWENPLTGGGPAAGGDRELPGGPTNGAGGSYVQAPNLAALHSDGSVTLADGSRVQGVEVVMYCTGYCYAFPFLPEGLLRVDDNRVGPLYQHVFPPTLAPTLSFVGLPWKVVPFPQFALQSMWIARLLSGQAVLPPHEVMERQIEAFYSALKAEGIPVRYTHRQNGSIQWEHNRWLAEQAGQEPLAAWRQQFYEACSNSRKLNGSGFRDVPLPGVEQAEAAAKAEADAAWARLPLLAAAG